MKTSAFALAALLALTSAASADPWKDDKGRWRGEYRDDYPGGGNRGDYAREYKEKFRQGDCKIERKWGRSGEYKEKIKCKGRYW